MNIKILCDQKDCIHNLGDYTGHDYSWENKCVNPDGVIISTKKGCQSKELTETAIILNNIGNTPVNKLDISIRLLNALKFHSITNVKELYYFYNKKEMIKKALYIGSTTRKEIESILSELKLI